MKGNFEIKITVTHTDKFPITQTFIMRENNTPEGVEDMVDYFKRVMYVLGYHPETIKDVFGDDSDS